jgi:anti-sigma B factor antagonist
MKTSTRQVNEVTILDLRGTITQQEGSAELRQTIKQLSGEGHKQILLNLREVSAIDTPGLGELVNAFSTLRDQGGELKLMNLSESVRNLIQMTKLHKLLDVRDDEATAVQAFSKSA